MMDSFDISELPERITQYRNQVLSEALTRNAPYLQQMMATMSHEQAVSLWQDVAQKAVNALGNYMEPRVDGLVEGDDPRVVFYEHDETEPVGSYISAWIEGYATRALGGRCSESEVRPVIEQSGISLYPMDNRIAYAETILPQRGYSRECISVAIGHAILSYAISVSGDVSPEEVSRFNWMGDIDGFADGWRYAQWHGLGYDEGYVPYSDEDQIDDFMKSLSVPADDKKPEADESTTSQVVSSSDEDDFEDVPESDLQMPSGVSSDTAQVETSLPGRYATVFDQTGNLSNETVGTTGIYIEVTEDEPSKGREPSGTTGIVTADDSAVFTTDDFEDVSEEEVLHIKTTVTESPESLTGPLVAVVSEEEAEKPEVEVAERTVRRLPPMFEKYLILTISSALRGNAPRLAELTEAGMTFEQSEHLKRKVMSATARYGLKELAIMGLEDGIPADDDGTEPVRTYANSWLQGYISVITDGDCSQHAIVKAALLSIVNPDEISDDVEHVIERQEWEGYDDECSMVTIAHLRVSLSTHGKGHPLAHAMEGTGRFNHRGATDGFSDGWWKATEIVRRMEASIDMDRIAQYEENIDNEITEYDKASDSDIDKAKEEAKVLLAGLFSEDDVLPEESVNDLIGPPMPVVVPISPTRAEESPTGDGDTGEKLPVEASHAEPVDPQEPRTQRETTPSAPTQAKSQDQPNTQSRIRKHADACTMQAVKQQSALIKRMWSNTNATKEAAKAWTVAVKQATASYGWHVVNDLNANPAKSQDGTRPMLTYASSWVMGYVAGFYGEEPTERMIQADAQRTGISLGETGQQVSYAQNVCSFKAYGAECMMSVIRHAKSMFLAHHPQNPQSLKLPDAMTYNWIADIDGYADGWFIGRRVRMQQQQQVSLQA